ncbi:hypothetical protein HNW13_000035 [Shewanella sp. BF02_Schw]|uniref:PapB/FocB family fimbrial expression transcriptional regulator n=1 Tax=Shewanella sp. BF02_Schw TaxID=394908 RepID=UPI00177EC512|nr:PapB/FocB family fimbrial expression transcriptional regulator [Shewanella sp. BF02_Schw]MBO1894193.1 hypothetical protein [Shewanella sp. BF02_Schw]
MKYLIQGGESLQRLQLLLSLTRMDSECMREALEDHYVLGFQDVAAVARNDIDRGNFTRAQKRLEQVAATVEQLKELDWAHFNHQQSCQLTDQRHEREITK